MYDFRVAQPRNVSFVKIKSSKLSKKSSGASTKRSLNLLIGFLVKHACFTHVPAVSRVHVLVWNRHACVTLRPQRRDVCVCVLLIPSWVLAVEEAAALSLHCLLVSERKRSESSWLAVNGWVTQLKAQLGCYFCLISYWWGVWTGANTLLCCREQTQLEWEDG